ncbi:hypothetical protein TcWFU_001432 [Taenia crassiceps]|uniref:G-protein coupled receptors family 1 profile domain-containing protein n=1 Tax=Taenia crassiceps TaxID=6207 RepID=A0ABR4QPA8_9CEST
MDTSSSTTALAATQLLDAAAPGSIPLAVTFCMITALTILGNTLVISAVLLVHKLRCPSNFLIVSLAASDLLVSTTVMPFSIYLEYRQYWARRIVKSDRIRLPPTPGDEKRNSVQNYAESQETDEVTSEDKAKSTSLCFGKTLFQPHCTDVVCLLRNPALRAHQKRNQTTTASLHLQGLNFSHHLRKDHRASSRNSIERPGIKRSNEAKAIRTLGVIMGVFCICWLPFFIVALGRPLYNYIHNTEKDIDPRLSCFFLWLGYVNSTLNPLIYAIFNREFRRPFWELMACHCLSINARLRERRYQHEYRPPPVSLPNISGGGGAAGETPSLPRSRNSAHLLDRRHSSMMTE